MTRTVWVALDFPTAIAADSWLARWEKVRQAPSAWPGEVRLGVKVGLELFTAAGPDAVRAWAARYPVFLDLKLHDIPRTVEGAVAAAGRMGVDTLTLHVSGGSAMLRQARRAGPGLRLMGVTLLTSLDAPLLQELGWEGPAAAWVERWAGIAGEAGLTGVVCSAHELSVVHRAFPLLACVVPGLRWGAGGSDDQRRVATPRQAWTGGATDLVVGRGLTAANDLEEAWHSLTEALVD